MELYTLMEGILTDGPFFKFVKSSLAKLNHTDSNHFWSGFRQQNEINPTVYSGAACLWDIRQAGFSVALIKQKNLPELKNNWVMLDRQHAPAASLPVAAQSDADQSN